MEAPSSAIWGRLTKAPTLSAPSVLPAQDGDCCLFTVRVTSMLSFCLFSPSGLAYPIPCIKQSALEQLVWLLSLSSARLRDCRARCGTKVQGLLLRKHRGGAIKDTKT